MALRLLSSVAENQLMNLLALALAPGIAIIIFILYKDKFNREPPFVLFVSFLFGVLSTLPAIGLEMAAGVFELSGIEGQLVFAFLGVALVEEFVKFVPLRLYSFTRRSFDEPMDGIVHGVMIAMGFAMLENVGYVYENGETTGWLRMFTAVPGHASWGVIMGYYAGKAKFNYKHRGRILLTGLLLATFFHGLYDGCLFATQEVDDDTVKGVLVIAAMSTHVFALVLAFRFMRRHRRLSHGLHRMKPVCTIRLAGESDIDLIRDLNSRVWPLTYEKILTRKQITYMMELMYSEGALQKQMRAGHQFIIVYNTGMPVGFASYSEVETGTYKLHKIYLLPNQQGKGTGRFTIEQILTDIRPKGATALQLQVNRNNKARTFYERLGFEVIREEKIDIGNGFFMDDYIMEKKL